MRTSISGCALAMASASSMILMRSHCRTNGKRVSFLEMDVIELGDQAGMLPVPVVELRRDDAARHELFIKSDAIEQFQRGRMIAARARHLVEELVVGKLLDQRDGNSVLRECQRQAQANRPGADHDHGLRRRHLARPL